MRVQPSVLLTLWSFLVFSVGSTLADGVVRDGLGATSIGRGGTNVAHFDNGVILLDNPGGLVNLPGNGLFELGFAGLITDLEYADPQSRRNNKHNPIALPDLAFIRKSADGTWAMGLGLFAPAGFGAQWDITNPLLGQQHYKSFGALLKVLPALSCRVTDRLSIGGTFGLAVSHAELEGPFFIQTGPLRGTPTLLDLQATGAAPTWSVGMQYRVSERTSLGLAYTEATRFRLTGNAGVNVVGLTPAPVNSSFDAQVDLVWPRSLAWGLTHTFAEVHRFSVDLFWYNWPNAFNNIDLKLTGASNPLLGAVVGPTFRDRFPLDWDDSLSVRLGYEYFLTPCDILRAGYTFHPQPIPTETLTPYIPAILEHAVSIGYGKQRGKHRFNVSYQYSFGPEQNVLNSGLAGGDFNQSDVRSQAHWLILSYSFQF